MPVPTTCTNPRCSNHTTPARRWLARFGSYHTIAHGTVRRYQCKACKTTMSDQTESLHYFAKRRLPLKAVSECLNTGTSMRDIARRYRVSPAAVRGGVLRLGRQAMAAHLVATSKMNPRTRVVFDGLRSFVTSQDYPCDITTVVDGESETILTMTHSIMTRGGTMRPEQMKRLVKKLKVWRPAKRSMKRDIQLLVNEIWDYFRADHASGSLIDTDEHPLYRAILALDPVWRHYLLGELARHRRTPGSAPRTMENPLFPVNYVDRLVRHRMREHARETIAFGRHAVVQMHRMWLFAWDHNMQREYRVRRPEEGTHAEQGVITPAVSASIRREFYVRRIRPRGIPVPETIRKVWCAELATPPVRWRVKQKGSTVKTPGFARADLLGA